MISKPTIINAISNCMKNLKLNLDSLYHKTEYLLVSIFLIFLPFNAISQIFFRYKLEVAGFAYFKELLLLTILGISFLFKFKRNFKKLFLENRLAQIVILYLTYILVSVLWADGNLMDRIVYGFKFDGFLFLCLLTGLSLSEQTVKKVNRLIRTSFISNGVALFIGLFIHFGINPEKLTAIGYRNDWSTFYSDQALAFCQRIEHSPICRFQGTFSGPNQAGANSLMTVCFGYFVARIRNFKDAKTNILAGVIVSLGLIAIYFSFSRSSLLALVVFIGLAGFYLFKKEVRNRILTILIIGTTIIGSATLIAAPETIFRLGSNNGRILLMKAGVESFANTPLIGQGIASSGPASHYLEGQTQITENWFLQVAINYGLVGFCLFIGIYALITYKLTQSKKYRIFGLLFIALLVPLNLLHYFEDSSFSYTLFLITGIILSRIDQKAQAKK